MAIFLIRVTNLSCKILATTALDSTYRFTPGPYMYVWWTEHAQVIGKVLTNISVMMRRTTESLNYAVFHLTLSSTAKQFIPIQISSHIL